MKKLRQEVARLKNPDSVCRRKAVALDPKEMKALQFLDLADILFIVFDENGIVIMVNKKVCEAFECTESQMINKNWFKLHKSYRTRSKVHEVPSIAHMINNHR